MKYYTVSFMIILFITSGCYKEVNNSSSSESKIKTTSLLDTITGCTWVFTEYHDKVTYQIRIDSTHFISGTNAMSIISDGNETAKMDNTGKILLKRNSDFSFAGINYFYSNFQPYSFVSRSYSEPYYDTVNYSLADKSIILSKSTKYLPDTMFIVNMDTACLVLSGILHTHDYDVKRTIVFYKNTRWYGGYRNFSGF